MIGADLQHDLSTLNESSNPLDGRDQLQEFVGHDSEKESTINVNSIPCSVAT